MNGTYASGTANGALFMGGQSTMATPRKTSIGEGTWKIHHSGGRGTARKQKAIIYIACLLWLYIGNCWTDCLHNSCSQQETLKFEVRTQVPLAIPQFIVQMLKLHIASSFEACQIEASDQSPHEWQSCAPATFMQGILALLDQQAASGLRKRCNCAVL